MTNEALTAYAYSHGRDITSFPMADASSLTLEDRAGNLHIAIQHGVSRRKEKVLLAHELGHCEHAGLYTRYSPYVLRERCEYRADKWAYLRLCPPGEVRQAARDGCVEAWEFAELFDVPCDFMQAALAYYRRVALL